MPIGFMRLNALVTERLPGDIPLTRDLLKMLEGPRQRRLERRRRRDVPRSRSCRSTSSSAAGRARRRRLTDGLARSCARHPGRVIAAWLVAFVLVDRRHRAACSTRDHERRRAHERARVRPRLRADRRAHPARARRRVRERARDRALGAPRGPRPGVRAQGRSARARARRVGGGARRHRLYAGSPTHRSRLGRPPRGGDPARPPSETARRPPADVVEIVEAANRPPFEVDGHRRVHGRRATSTRSSSEDLQKGELYCRPAGGAARARCSSSAPSSPRSSRCMLAIVAIIVALALAARGRPGVSTSRSSSSTCSRSWASRSGSTTRSSSSPASARSAPPGAHARRRDRRDRRDGEPRRALQRPGVRARHVRLAARPGHDPAQPRLRRDLVGFTSVLAALTLLPAVLGAARRPGRRAADPASSASARTGEGRFWVGDRPRGHAPAGRRLVASMAVLLAADSARARPEDRDLRSPHTAGRRWSRSRGSSRSSAPSASGQRDSAIGRRRRGRRGRGRQRRSQPPRRRGCAREPALRRPVGRDEPGGRPHGGRGPRRRATAATSGRSNAVERLRERDVPTAFAGVDAEVLVTGETAEEIDYTAVMRTWLPRIARLRARRSASCCSRSRSGRSWSRRRRSLLNLLSVGAAYGAGRARLPEGRRQRAARLRSRSTAIDDVAADLPLLRPLRPLDGLPRLPAQPDPRALRRDGRHARRARARRSARPRA